MHFKIQNWFEKKAIIHFIAFFVFILFHKRETVPLHKNNHVKHLYR
ncbi:MAG: hypothetical protein ACI8W0_000425, partial [Flavobacterium sp.]